MTPRAPSAGRALLVRLPVLAAGLVALAVLALAADNHALARDDDDDSDDLLRAHAKEVTALQVSADRTLLVSVSADHCVKLWSLPDGDLEGSMLAHQDTIHAVAVHPTKKLLASGGADKYLRFWEFEAADVRTATRLDKITIHALANIPGETLLASAESDGRVRLRDWDKGTVVDTLAGHPNIVRVMAVSRDGNRLASGGGENKSILLWDLPGRASQHALERHTARTNALAFTADGDTLVSAGDDGKLHWWAVADGSLRRTTPGTGKAVHALAVSPDGKLLAVGSADATIQLWSLEPGKPGTLQGTIKGHTMAVKAVVFADDQTLIAGDAAGVVQAWDVRTRLACADFFDEEVSVADGLVVAVETATGKTQKVTLPAKALEEAEVTIPQGVTVSEIDTLPEVQAGDGVQAGGGGAGGVARAPVFVGRPGVVIPVTRLVKLGVTIRNTTNVSSVIVMRNAENKVCFYRLADRQAYRLPKAAKGTTIRVPGKVPKPVKVKGKGKGKPGVPPPPVVKKNGKAKAGPPNAMLLKGKGVFVPSARRAFGRPVRR